ncbi:MAG TPA: hypothetical protein VK419_03900 [Bryobacteraceae bacterium]|nr:hypothetical protein [Bryobacteraceae bacterium]
MKQRPLAVTVIGWVYIVAGAAVFASHLPELASRRVWQFDVWGVGLIELAAVVAGIFLLRGRNWARWMAVAWIGFHVVVSAWNAWSRFAVHGVIFAGIAWLLFRRDAGRYFQASA